MDHIVGGKFKLGKKIGSGSFGELFLGESSLRPTPQETGRNMLFFLSVIFRKKKDADFAAALLLCCSRECADRGGSRRQIGMGFRPFLASFCFADLGATV